MLFNCSLPQTWAPLSFGNPVILVVFSFLPLYSFLIPHIFSLFSWCQLIYWELHSPQYSCTQLSVHRYRHLDVWQPSDSRNTKINSLSSPLSLLLPLEVYTGRRTVTLEGTQGGRRPWMIIPGVSNLPGYSRSGLLLKIFLLTSLVFHNNW